jgi:hypothetical protein
MTAGGLPAADDDQDIVNGTLQLNLRGGWLMDMSHPLRDLQPKSLLIQI